MKTEPWHSAISTTYHDETACLRGQQVKPENRRAGTGGKFHCHFCKKLERKRRMRQRE